MIEFGIADIIILIAVVVSFWQIDKRLKRLEEGE